MMTKMHVPSTVLHQMRIPIRLTALDVLTYFWVYTSHTLIKSLYHRLSGNTISIQSA